MNNIINKIIKIYERDDFPFILIFLVYGLVNLFLPTIADDVVLREQYKGLSIWAEKDLIIYDYFNWSSRIIVNSVIHLLLRTSQYIWAILNTVSIFVLLKSISKLTVINNKRKVNLIISILFILYPYYQMGTAGWVTTSVTYLWVLTAGVIALIPIRKIINKEKFKKREYIIYSLALLFSANQEQMSIILLVIYILFVIYLFIINNKNYYIIVQAILSVLSIIFIMTTPGNDLRSATELVRFKDYGTISFIDKLEIGFTSTMEHFLTKPKESVLFLVFISILFYFITKKYKSVFYSLIAIIPAVIIIGFKIVEPLNEKFPLLLQPLNSYGFVNVNNYPYISTYFKLFLMCIIVCSVLVSLYLVYENTLQSIFMIFLFLIGLGSRVALGFSPTIWASGDRTFIFLYFIIIAISINIYSLSIKDKIINNKEDMYLKIILSMGSLIVFNNMLKIIL